MAYPTLVWRTVAVVVLLAVALLVAVLFLPLREALIAVAILLWVACLLVVDEWQARGQARGRRRRR